MNTHLKKLYYDYQRAQWYAGFTDQEYSKIARFVSPTLLISLATYLKVTGITVRWWQFLIGFLALFIVFVLLGVILVKLGIVAYNNKLSNHQNNELMEIVEWVRKQK